LVGAEPYRRLVVANSVGVAGDALFTVSLAGSLFFNVSADAARPTILLYLLLTLAPFAVIGPFVGTAVDRFPGSQRGLIAFTNLGRAIAMALIAGELHSLAFFPLAFTVLVFSKGSSIAVRSLVPWLVGDDDRLVAENARLSRATALVGGCAGAIGAVLLAVSSTQVVLFVAAVVHLLAMPLAMRIPKVHVVGRNPIVDDVELRGSAVILAANATSAMRAGVGFLAFFIAFNLKVSGEPAWFFGVVIAAGGAGGFLGTYLAAFMRRHVNEEMLLALSLATAGAAALVAPVQYEEPAILMVAFTIGVAASASRQAFDSLTQRLAPDAEKGRAFARFETRFQIAWVVGAVIAVLGRPGNALGLSGLGIVLGGAGGLYLVSLRALRRHRLVVETSLDRREQNLSRSLLAIASALHAQGADRLAVTTAADAVRVACATTRNGASLGPELDEIWLQAVQGTGPLGDGLAARAIELAQSSVDAAESR
jgi:predicted MFS family arabinose efflux permease